MSAPFLLFVWLTLVCSPGLVLSLSLFGGATFPGAFLRSRMRRSVWVFQVGWLAWCRRAAVLGAVATLASIWLIGGYVGLIAFFAFPWLAAAAAVLAVLDLVFICALEVEGPRLRLLTLFSSRPVVSLEWTRSRRELCLRVGADTVLLSARLPRGADLRAIRRAWRRAPDAPEAGPGEMREPRAWTAVLLVAGALVAASMLVGPGGFKDTRQSGLALLTLATATAFVPEATYLTMAGMRANLTVVRGVDGVGLWVRRRTTRVARLGLLAAGAGVPVLLDASTRALYGSLLMLVVVQATLVWAELRALDVLWITDKKVHVGARRRIFSSLRDRVRARAARTGLELTSPRGSVVVHGVSLVGVDVPVILRELASAGSGR